MIFIIIGRWKGSDFPEYVRRAEKTITKHAAGYEDVEILDRFYAVGQRMFFSIAQAESRAALMRILTPYLDLCDMEVIPVMRGPETMDVWLGREPSD